MMDLYFALRASYENQNENTSTGSAQAVSDNYLRVLALFKKLELLRFVAATQWVLGEVFRKPLL